MKRALPTNIGLMIVAGLFLISVPLFFYAYESHAAEAPPSVGQTLVREGTFAVELSKAFGLPGDVSEVEAESWLSEKGVLPENGWIADYPVTPDIIGELRTAVGTAGEMGKINMDKAGALSRFDQILAELKLDIQPLSGGRSAQVAEYNDEIVPADTVASYYVDEGPPVVTYYAPPPDYYGMYSWISYPFWCDGFWFGGYFILNDFDRPVFIGRDHHRGFITNHFRDREHHRFTRINPLTRASGIRATGIGASNLRSNPAGTRQSIRSTTPPPAIRSTSVNTNLYRSTAPTTMRTAPFRTPGNQMPYRGTERGFAPRGGGYVSRADNQIAVRSGIPYQSRVSEPVRTFSIPVRRPEMPSAFTAPRSNPTRMSFTTAAPRFSTPGGFSRSFNSGFSGGFSSRGSGGFSSRVSGGGFSGGHSRR